MLRGIERALWASLLCMVWLTGCSAALVPVPTPVPGLVVTLLYPHPDTEWVVFYALEVDKTYLIRVSVDFNYGETNSLAVFRTHETQFTLPESLYRTPNCGVFNWQVTMLRGAGGSGNGGRPISHPSLYRYVEWRYPPGVQAPFVAACPNAQF